jgi:predicted metal-dependent phosphoesterase TrpH
MWRVDLHTHSAGSPDGSLELRHYWQMLQADGLGTIAITDHDTIEHAQAVQRELGERIIVGEEITTTQGELIGLYLHETVAPGQTAFETAQAIRAQGGLVYVPHPFETLRQGLSLAVLDEIAGEVDIVETYNGRAWTQRFGRQAARWATEHQKATAASSDAHGPWGWGRTYSTLSEPPHPQNLAALLKLSQQSGRNVGGAGRLHPQLNRWRR